MKPKLSTKFPIPDKALVQALKASSPSNWKISTRFQPNSIESPQIIISFAGGEERNNETYLFASFNIKVSCRTYSEVEEVSYSLIQILKGIKTKPFSYLTIESYPIFFSEDGVSQEQRLITISALIGSIKQ